jgi:hypothetical protein
MEHKTISFEIKALDGDGRTLEGFCAAFGNIDQVGDVIHPGAFRKTLTERGGRIKFLWQHDPTEPIGRLVEAREDTGGLYVKAIISDTQRGRDAIALLRDGAIGEMSIGYDAVKGGTDYSKTPEGKSVRNLREIKLYEFSLVTFPANEAAVVTALKDADPGDPGDPGDADEGEESEPDAEPEGDKKSIGTLAESRVHNLFTNFADEWYGDERITREERIILSGAIGAALDAFVKKIKNDAGQLYSRNLYEYDVPQSAMKSLKAGRTISRATAAELRAARDVLDKLIAMAEMSEPETEPAPDEKAAEEHEHKAGPVNPPTSAERLLKLVELELTTLEV